MKRIAFVLLLMLSLALSGCQSVPKKSPCVGSGAGLSVDQHPHDPCATQPF